MAFALGAPAAVMNAIVLLIEPAQVDGAKEHTPGSRGERLQADRERGQDVGHVDPSLVPPNAAVGRDASDLEVLGVGDRPQPGDIEPVGRGIERPRAPLTEGFVRPLFVEGTAEAIFKSRCMRSWRPF